MKNKKVLLQPCGLYYMVSILMCNTHTILHYPQILQYFQCRPPTLAEYFHGRPVESAEMEQWMAESAWAEFEVPKDVKEWSAT